MQFRLTWSARRQILYYGVALIILAILVWVGYQTFFNNAPTCNDRIQNGTEQGVDCGGSCALLCQAQTRSPVVLWSRAFEVVPGTYTAAAYVQNPNVGIAAGAGRVGYSFQLFDSNNLLVAERNGVADLPPVQSIPLIEPSIDVGTRTVARALFAFTSVPVWERAGTTPTLRVTNQELAQDASRLSVRIINDTITDARRVTVATVLYDAAGTARAASKSVIAVSKKSSQEVTFTWPGGVPNIVRAEVVLLQLL